MPEPIIEGLLGRLDQTRYISSIDFNDAFWQIPLDEGSRDKAAFTVPGRPLYQFAVMPKDYPVPKNTRQIRRFLGMTGYYGRFTPNYSSIAAPLTILLSKNKTFKWTNEAQVALDELKLALISAPVLDGANGRTERGF